MRISLSGELNTSQINLKYMKNISAFLLILMLVSCNDNNNKDNERNGWYGPELYGDIASLTIKEFELLSKFGEEQVGNLLNLTKYIFNKSGDVTEICEYNADGNLKYLTKNVYDEKGNHIEHVYYQYGREMSKHRYSYDNMGNIIETARVSGDKVWQTTIFHYNQSNNRTESLTYDVNHILEKKSIYKYDNIGNNIERQDYDHNGEIVYWEKYIYDTSNNLIEEKWENPFMRTSGFCRYSYDENGNETDSYDYDQYGNLIEHNTYSYDLDGNEIEHKIFGSTGEIESEEFSVFNDKGHKIEYVEKAILTNYYNHWKEEYVYDKYGNISTIKTYKGDTNIPNKLTVWIFEYE